MYVHLFIRMCVCLCVHIQCVNACISVLALMLVVIYSAGQFLCALEVSVERLVECVGGSRLR